MTDSDTTTELRKTPITEAEIMARQTKNGGWTRNSLREWGVPWPPPIGWRKQLLATGYPYQDTLKIKAGDELLLRGTVTRVSGQNVTVEIDGLITIHHTPRADSSTIFSINQQERDVMCEVMN
jgi:hypothetical protein